MGRGCWSSIRARLDALNMIDEAVTLATLAPFDLLTTGEMAATVKIIPFCRTRVPCWSAVLP